MTKYLTTAEVAEYLRMSVDTVRYWHWKGEGPESVKIGRRRLYAEHSVEAFVESRKAGVGA